MNRSLRLLAVACVLAACTAAGERAPAAQSCADAERGWCPARYGTLVMGRSTREELVRALGEPRETERVPGPTGGADEIWYHYRVAEPAAGELVVVLDSMGSRVRSAMLHPDALTRAQAERAFGGAATPFRYAEDECLSDGESVPLYESRDGPVVRLEYRGQGLSLAPRQGTDLIDHVLYLSGPLAPPSSRCADRSA